MLSDEEQNKLKMGIEAVDNGDTRYGLFCLESLFEKAPNPVLMSYYAVCLAKERKELQRASDLCSDALVKDPGNTIHYLNIGRVYLAFGMKREAIKAFRDGLLYRKNPTISRELEKLGWRDLPIIPSLGRENLLNRILGKIYAGLGLR
jgi:predicted Zn-dependent protease